MITVILELVCLVALTILFLKPLKNNNTVIMAGIVMAMLLISIVDELTIPAPEIVSYGPSPKKVSSSSSSAAPSADDAGPQYKLNISTEIYKNTPARPLLKQQRTLLNYLLQKDLNHENYITIFKDIDSSRFRAIIKQFQETTKAPAVEVDFSNYDYRYTDFQYALARSSSSNRITYFMIQNIKSFKSMIDLENIFLTRNVSYLMSNSPSNLFEVSNLKKWSQQYKFEGNYINQVLENHPPRLVEICNKYCTIDYAFYVRSQSEPLSELCTKQPSNKVTECIRNYMQKFDDKVPFSKVRNCWEGGVYKNTDGVTIDNGLVGLKKDYFYAGKIDKSIFAIDGTSPVSPDL